jgi:hypothetical protein
VSRSIRRFYPAPVKITRDPGRFPSPVHQQLLKPAAEKAIVFGGADPGFAIIWLQSKPANRDGRETDAMKRLMVTAAVLALIALPAHAQMGGGGKRGKTDDKKTDDSASKKVDEKAYKAALERIPDPKEKYDPWGVARPADANKKP